MDVIDNSYIWQRRILHGVRGQKVMVPFPESVRVGLDFNAALERDEKLDVSLLTNGLMLELLSFAKTVVKSEKYFLFELLAYNFDLSIDMDSDMLYYEYASRIHHKVKLVKEQIKMKPQRFKEVFTIPDLSFLIETSSLDTAKRYFPKRNNTVDVSTLTDVSRSSASSQGIGAAFVFKKPRGRLKVWTDAFPFCRELGLTLAIQPDESTRQKLDPGLINNGVMMEFLDFAKVLCGLHGKIVSDLVKQNFGLELDRISFRTQVTRLMERKQASKLDGTWPEVLSERFRLQSNRQGEGSKRKQEAEADEEMGSPKKTRTMPRNTSPDGDLMYTCPLEFDIEVASEAGEGLASSPFLEDPDPGTAAKTWKQKLWTRRGSRVKDIVREGRVNDVFVSCREAGLDLNVGSGNKRHLDPQLLTGRVLFEIHKFATELNSSHQSFLFEILNKNFRLVLQSEAQKCNLLYFIITKEQFLQNHADGRKSDFLCSPFPLPETYVGGHIEPGRDSKTDSDRETRGSSEEDTELHPYCKKIGLSLWSTNERPGRHRLDLSALTNGAVLEVLLFGRELCGSVPELMRDLLEHNFTLTLERKEVEAMIQSCLSAQKSVTKNSNLSFRIPNGLNPNGASREPEAGGRTEAEVSVSPEAGGETNSSIPRQEKSAGGFGACSAIGLDLDVSNLTEAKAKLDLRVLTRRALLEIHRYVQQNCLRYVPALYQILDYNFDLSSQGHRKVEFAWSIASQVIALAGKWNRKRSYLDRVFELPFELPEEPDDACKDEPDGDPGGAEPNGDDVVFVRKLEAVDIEVEI